jgi:SAM-dependent methyltransferase
MSRKLDYDALASSYDARYARTDYAGVEDALRAFAAGTSDVLEVGCGTGHWLALLGGLRVAGLDASSEMLARARARCSDAELVEGRASRLPWPDAHFDRLFSINALHHFDDRAAYFAEARRVLRPGGGLLTVGLDPHTGADRWFVYDYFEGTRARDLERYPAASHIRDELAAAGFERCETRVVQRFPMAITAGELLARGHADKHTTSQLALLTDEAYAAGRRKLEALPPATPIDSDLSLWGTTAWRP